MRVYTAYREQAPAPVHRQPTPTAEINLIVSFGDSLCVRPAPEVGEFQNYTSFVAGIHDLPTRTMHDGRQLGLQIRLDPLGAFSLLGVPMCELSNRVVELSQLLGDDAERWTARLRDAPSWEERFALMDGRLAARMTNGPLPSPQVAWVWHTMRLASGAVRVGELADRAGCSHRHLIAGFREQVGMTPKAAAQILRYERAVRLLTSGGAAPVEVAVACGYADQSHLTRELTRLAGTTPAALARSAL